MYENWRHIKEHFLNSKLTGREKNKCLCNFPHKSINEKVKNVNLFLPLCHFLIDDNPPVAPCLVSEDYIQCYRVFFSQTCILFISIYKNNNFQYFIYKISNRSAKAKFN